MTALFGLLDLGAGAYQAATQGAAVSGTNVANAGQAGYSRQVLQTHADGITGGVRIDGAMRIDSRLLAGREQQAAADLGYADAMRTALVELDAGLSSQHDNVVGAIADLFGSLVDLSSSPLDPVVRRDVVSSASHVATAFGSAVRTVQQGIADAEAGIRDVVGQASALAQTIAELNETIAAGPDPALADRRDLAARRLAELVGGRARIDADGAMRFVMGGGVVLVDGRRAARLQAVPDAALDGRTRIDVVDGPHRADATEAAGGGRLGALLAFREGPAVQARGRLDRLALDLATALDAAHAGGEAPDGTTGLPLFAPIAGVDGAAAALRVDAAIAADPGLLATVAPGEGPGGVGNLLAMIELRDAAAAAGGERTFLDEAIDAIASVGIDTQRADRSLEVERARADVIAAMRDSLSGVSIEEEMARLSQFQHAAAAATRFIAIVDEMLAHLVATI